MTDSLKDLSREEIIYRMEQLQKLLDYTELDETTPYPEFYRVLGKKIDYHIIQKRFKYGDFAKRVGIARSTLWRIIKGRPCHVHTLYQIAQVLGVDVCELLPMSLEETTF